MVTQSDRDRARYEERFKAQLDARSLHKAAEDTGIHKGREQGRQEGRQEGLEEGRREGFIERIHAYQEMLRQPQTSRDELLALGAAELERMVEQLELQVRKALRPNGST
jgi:flagellar biosynthesis/type III secretory pathway protein FliH